LIGEKRKREIKKKRSRTCESFCCIYFCEWTFRKVSRGL